MFEIIVLVLAFLCLGFALYLLLDWNDYRYVKEQFKEITMKEWKQKERGKVKMKITTLSELIAKREGGKKQISIAQIKEVLKIINELTDGEFYKMVRKMP